MLHWIHWRVIKCWTDFNYQLSTLINEQSDRLTFELTLGKLSNSWLICVIVFFTRRNLFGTAGKNLSYSTNEPKLSPKQILNDFNERFKRKKFDDAISGQSNSIFIRKLSLSKSWITTGNSCLTRINIINAMKWNWNSSSVKNQWHPAKLIFYYSSFFLYIMNLIR